MIIGIAHIIVFFVEMLISCIFFNALYERRYKLISTVIIGVVLFEIGALTNILIISSVWINAILSFLINYCFALFCFKAPKLKSAFYAVLLVALSSVLEVILVLIVSSLNQLNISDYETQPLFLVAEIATSKIIYFILILLLLRFIRDDAKSAKTPVSFYVYPTSALFSVVCFWYISTTEVLTYRSQIIVCFVCSILFVATVFLFFAYQYNAERESRLFALQQAEEKTKTDMVYYEILEKQNTNLRTYAHDAKNHLSAIKNLNKDPDIENYISVMIENLANYSNTVHSGNKVFDVIINKYMTECSLRNIRFDIDTKNNNLSKIENYDLVTILGNLLDNAVEAVEKTESRTISLETDYRNNFSVIIVSNDCSVPPQLDNNFFPLTTKSNKETHGFGIKNIRKTVKKYNGDLSFDYDDNKQLFIATIMLNI